MKNKRIKSAVLLSMLLILFTVPITTTQAATAEDIEGSITDAFGYWYDGVSIYAETSFVLVKLQERAYDLYLDPFDDDPMSPTYYQYAENVKAGWSFILPYLSPVSVADPDTNDNGIGLRIGNSIYYTSIFLMAVAATGKPDEVNELGGDFNGVGGPDTYGDIAQDVVDWLAQAQTDLGNGRGGWYYGDYPGIPYSDNSNSGYAVLGLAAAEGFGSVIPEYVRDELNIWIDFIQNDVEGGSGYSHPSSWVNLLKTGNLIFQMTFYGDEPDSPRFLAAMDYIETHWLDVNLDPGWGYNRLPPAHYQAMYCLMKGFEYSQIDLLDLDGDDIPEHDWFDEFSTVLIDQQNPDGSWPNSPCYVSGEWWGQESRLILSTVWALLILERIAPPPPVIPVNIDIKPGSWPNPINPKSQGELPVAICGTDEFDVMEIDPVSIIITIEDSEEEVSPLRWSLEDVATPYTDGEGGGHELTEDGYLDLVLHFDTQEVVNTLILTYYIGETIPLIIQGNLMGDPIGTPIKGQDFVRILGKALDPIFIDDEGGGDFTWKEASKQWWCQGAGTGDDPYIIENLKINAAGTGQPYCIRVFNSDANFIIRNCILYGIDVMEPGGAIALNNAENGIIWDNLCLDNGHPMLTSTSGISILDSNNNIIIGNDCTGNTGVGIYIASSSDNYIINNYCRGSQYGIIITGESEFTIGDTANENRVMHNTVSNNVQYGIILQIEANSNIVTWNEISENFIGILFVDSSDDNDIMHNTILYNEGGIYFHWATGLDHCIDNHIDHNDFLYNIWPWSGAEEPPPTFPPQWWVNNDFGPNNYVVT
jgi:parallel beta-helix repeat protein